MAANPQTPPSRQAHYEDPPVLPSVKGTPFTDERIGGSPPGDGFCPSRGWLVSGPSAGPRMRRQAPPPHASLPATGPTLETSGQVHRIPGVVSGETEAFPATQRTARFPVDHTIQQLCHPPHRPSAQGRPADVGPGRGACQGSTPGGAGLGGQDHRPRTRSSVVSQAWAQPWRLRVLVWLKQPTLPRGGNLGPGGFHSKVCATYARRDCDPCNLGLPELQPPYL